MSALKGKKPRRQEFPTYPDWMCLMWILLAGDLGACAYVDEVKDPKSPFNQMNRNHPSR